MRKLLANLKEKRFYNERKTEVCRHSPTSDQVYVSSGEAGDICDNRMLGNVFFRKQTD